MAGVLPTGYDAGLVAGLDLDDAQRRNIATGLLFGAAAWRALGKNAIADELGRAALSINPLLIN